jgi:hypothetical protein
VDIEGTNLAELVFIVWFPRLGWRALESSDISIWYPSLCHCDSSIQGGQNQHPQHSHLICNQARFVPIHEITILFNLESIVSGKSAIRGNDLITIENQQRNLKSDSPVIYLDCASTDHSPNT